MNLQIIDHGGGLKSVALLRNESGQEENGRKSPKSSGHIPELRAETQNSADHIFDQWRQVAGYRHVVR
jgi:hypothetical protein